MKNAMFCTLGLIFISALHLPYGFTQDSPQWGLPEGAKVRFSKGVLNEIQCSPDGTRLAVASGVGIWLYNTATHCLLGIIAKNHGGDLTFTSKPGKGTTATVNLPVAP